MSEIPAHERYVRTVVACLDELPISYGEVQISAELPRRALIQIAPDIYYGGESLEAAWSEEQGWWLIVMVDRDTDDPGIWLNFMEHGVLPPPSLVAKWIYNEFWSEGMPSFTNVETHYRTASSDDQAFEQEVATMILPEPSSVSSR